MSELVLTSELRDGIEREGVIAYPNECCGVLVGRDTSDGRLVEELHAIPNVSAADEQYHRFAADPQAQMRIEKEADARGKTVLGFYHSHPDHPARPSETDRQAAWPFYSYIIVAIRQAKPAEMTCWLLDEKSETFRQQEIHEISQTT
jgi:proteasome lid subunit RPN8/RPN11